MDRDVVIIGAGHNGLTCAYYLAKKGLKVAILEAADIGRRRGGDRRVPARLPQFRRRLHRQPAQPHGHPRPRARAPRAQGRAAQDRQFPSRRRRLSARRARRPDAARRSRGTTSADAEGYDRYIAELETVVRLLKKWLLRAPPNVGSRAERDPQAVEPGPRHGRPVAGRNPHRPSISPCAAPREVLDRHFEGDIDQGVVRVRRRRRQFRLAPVARHGLRAAPPSVRRGGRCPRRMGPCDRRHGIDYPGDGPRLPRGRASTSCSATRSRK